MSEWPAGVAALVASGGCVSRPTLARSHPPLHGSVFGLVASHDVLAAPVVFAELGHFLAQCHVLLLQEGGPHGDLVLLQPAGVTGAFCRHVVLLSPLPVLLVLQR